MYNTKKRCLPPQAQLSQYPRTTVSQPKQAQFQFACRPRTRECARGAHSGAQCTQSIRDQPDLACCNIGVGGRRPEQSAIDSYHCIGYPNKTGRSSRSFPCSQWSLPPSAVFPAVRRRAPPLSVYLCECFRTRLFAVSFLTLTSRSASYSFWICV